MVELARRAAGRQAAEDRRLPDAGRPVRDADVGGHREHPREAGIKTVYTKTYPADTKNFDAIANAVKAANPDLVVAGTQFEDGVGFLRALGKVGFTPKWLFQTNAPSFGDQYSEGVGADNTEGVFYAVSHSQEAQTRRATRSSSPSTRRCSAATACPRTRPTRYAAAQVLQATVEANKTVAKADQLKLADWLRSNSVPTDPRRAELERGRQPEGPVPARPVAGRQAGDRAARRGHDE